MAVVSLSTIAIELADANPSTMSWSSQLPFVVIQRRHRHNHHPSPYVAILSMSPSITIPSNIYQVPFDIRQCPYGPFHPPTSIHRRSFPLTRCILQIICIVYIRIRYHILQTICMYSSRSYIGFFIINTYIYILSY